ncbi:MAG TPA: AEC family transporter [Rhodanobacter sp.]|nr:AEC family transporter [Rhodanobacter sp.]
MAALLLLFVCLILGALVRRFAHPPDGTVRGINWWVLNVALPALVLELIPKVALDPQLWFLVVAMWLTFGGAWLLFGLLGPRLGWSRQRTGALILVCGLGNTAYMGYPMIAALRGESGLKLAVVADQLGASPVLASLAVVVACVYAGRDVHPRMIARRILGFPAFIALIVGIVVGRLGGWPPMFDGVFKPIGETLTPLALFSVGMQFRLRGSRGQWGAAACGLGWKLVAAPALCWALAAATGVGGPVMMAGVLQAAMAPMVSATILADEYRLDPELANTVLGVGIVLSLLTVPLANHWLPGG